MILLFHEDAVIKIVVPNVAENQCPPPFILIYTIRDILYPDIILERVTDLLNLLAQLDHIRRVAVRHAQEALALHNSYIKDPNLNKELVNFLSTTEVKSLLDFAKPAKAAAHRNLYRTIVLTFSYFVRSLSSAMIYLIHFHKFSIFMICGHLNNLISCQSFCALILPFNPI